MTILACQVRMMRVEENTGQDLEVNTLGERASSLQCRTMACAVTERGKSSASQDGICNKENRASCPRNLTVGATIDLSEQRNPTCCAPLRNDKAVCGSSVARVDRFTHSDAVMA